jgi:hypothetical protein
MIERRNEMSKTRFALVASLALMLAGPAGSYAGDAKKGTQEKTFKGEIVSVNSSANEFTVRGKKDGKVQEMTFSVEVPVGIKLEGQIVPLGELAKGDPVTVTYEANGKASVAKNLHRDGKATK